MPNEGQKSNMSQANARIPAHLKHMSGVIAATLGYTKERMAECAYRYLLDDETPESAEWRKRIQGEALTLRKVERAWAVSAGAPAPGEKRPR